MESLLRAAREYLERGFSVIPVAIMRMTGRKVALVKWEEFQHRKPTLEEVESWFSDLYQFKLIQSGNDIGIAIVTGCVSGNLAVIDFDNPEAHAELSKVLEAAPGIYEKLINTWIVETGKGFHYYVRVKVPDPEKFTNRLKLGGKDIDIRAEGGYVVAPPSPHPSGKTYRFVNKPEEIAELTWEEYLTLLRVLEEGKESQPASSKASEFPESKILEIVNIVKPIYRPGNRHYVVHYLTAWLRKAGVPFEAARKIVELLAEDDEEKSNRLYQVEWNYGLKGKDKPEEELKGKSGLQEIAESLLGEGKALELIRKLEEVIGRASPFRDSIFSLVDFSKRLYYVANLRKGIIARAYEDQRNGGGIVYKELIAECVPTKVVVYEDPLGGVRKFEITFEGFLNRTIGPADLETIAARLKAEGVVKHRRLIEDALSSLVIAFIRNGRAEIRRELEKPGFYYIDGELKAVKWESEEFEKEDLRRALELVKELREKWYPHLAERFTTIIKWGLIAPFSYAIKQIRGTYGIHFPWLFLHGSASTGKTTLGRIIKAIWNLPLEEKG